MPNGVKMYDCVNSANDIPECTSTKMAAYSVATSSGAVHVSLNCQRQLVCLLPTQEGGADWGESWRSTTISALESTQKPKNEVGWHLFVVLVVRTNVLP